MFLREFVEIDGWYEIIALSCLACGVIFGIGLSVSDMVTAINYRKEEIVEDMWDEGYSAKGQNRKE